MPTRHLQEPSHARAHARGARAPVQQPALVRQNCCSSRRQCGPGPKGQRCAKWMGRASDTLFCPGPLQRVPRATSRGLTIFPDFATRIFSHACDPGCKVHSVALRQRLRRRNGATMHRQDPRVHGESGCCEFHEAVLACLLPSGPPGFLLPPPLPGFQCSFRRLLKLQQRGRQPDARLVAPLRVGPGRRAAAQEPADVAAPRVRAEALGGPHLRVQPRRQGLPPPGQV
mmetsp:Transcript_140715/g.392208  ORF Transcript_140715/g.392208 Transcript_140715/m.392208 type:complete len:228 (+) Transcript_140715:70-753(+)